MRRESGATMTEYVLMVALIAIALVAAVIIFEGGLSGSLETSADCLDSLGSAGAVDCPGTENGG